MMGPTLSTHVATLHADLTRSLQARGFSAAVIASIVGTEPGTKTIPAIVSNLTATLTKPSTPALPADVSGHLTKASAFPAATRQEKDSIQKALGH